jgi:hypothetical protein
LAVSVSADAIRRAAGQVRALWSGDHPTVGAPIVPDGSKHTTAPRRRRSSDVLEKRSPFTLVATTGPGQSTSAGMANPVVFLLWVGPNTITDCPGSAASVRRPDRPITSRAGGADRRSRRLVATVNVARSRPRAQRALATGAAKMTRRPAG